MVTSDTDLLSHSNSLFEGHVYLEDSKSFDLELGDAPIDLLHLPQYNKPENICTYLAYFNNFLSILLL